MLSLSTFQSLPKTKHLEERSAEVKEVNSPFAEPGSSASPPY